jgi:hypothetical protein
MNKGRERQPVFDLLEALHFRKKDLAMLLGSDERTIARWMVKGAPQNDTASVILFGFLLDAVRAKNEGVLNLACESVKFGGLRYFLHALQGAHFETSALSSLHLAIKEPL